MWALQIVNSTEGWTFSINETTTAPAQVSAEVVVETPEVCSSTCSIAALADFHSVAFTNISVSTNGVTGAITASNYFGVEINRGSSTLAMPGYLNPAGTAFVDTWENS